MQVWEQHREGRKMHALFCHAMLRGWALDAGAKPDTGDSSTTAKYTARRAAAIPALGKKNLEIWRECSHRLKRAMRASALVPALF
jgi:hypothetical protein